MGKKNADELLLDQKGLRVSRSKIVTDLGEYEFERIESVRQHMHRPMWGPVFLSILGTLNLAIAFQTGALRDFIASAVMLGVGFLWWTRGTRYTLAVKVDGKENDVWLTRRRPQMEQVLQVIEPLVRKTP